MTRTYNPSVNSRYAFFHSLKGTGLSHIFIYLLPIKCSGLSNALK